MKIVNIKPEMIDGYSTAGLIIVKGTDGGHLALFPYHHALANESLRTLYPNTEDEADVLAGEFIEKARAAA